MLKRGDRIRHGRQYGTVRWVSPQGTVWYASDDGRYCFARAGELERCHGNKHRSRVAA